MLLSFSRSTTLVAAAFLSFLSGGAALAGQRLVQPTLEISDVPPGKREVAITLDACSGEFDSRIASALIDGHVPATIFVTGRWLRRNGEALALLLAHRDLFQIEDHGQEHLPAVTGNEPIYGVAPAGDLPAIRREVQDGAQSVLTATGAAPHWYRDATALYSPEALPAIKAMGFSVAGFSLNADQGASLPARTVEGRIAAAKSGDVIIAHVNQPHRASGQGVADGIRALQKQGVTFVRLDQVQTRSKERITVLHPPRVASRHLSGQPKHRTL
ncbi:Peptidoglycan/xylan/chitin deacetylase, PgdA/CDA1 family [Faunimonas pinastri]|uniref:Chitooligosaccharide deacetylase n=1 Tax=Faunimonas pinastri TaxID=1855383 RepID=A0A1H9AHD4_9HYPH|nr:polysaccharide deacetylase family protein [Faunimonas pinastri]SEP76015.1 Peptidoglycan/xylan/chitin deacetylase, PgdA/CDA1 family [Faunimonas pinastri]